ncbi:MAG: cob(I)yrinic acid a,c-diamide adenosyltransferase [Acidobacteriota bacterium]
MSIATKRGDAGQTDLIGRVRVSKSHPCVEAYGNLDELTSQLGFARSICRDEEVRDLIRTIQRHLFRLSAAVTTAPASNVSSEPGLLDLVPFLDEHLQRIEATEGILADWSLPGDLPEAAALDVARTVCRRAERSLVRLTETDGPLQPEVLAYLNRLSDLLWLLGRLLEVRAGVNSALREKPGNRWSAAW